MAILTPYFHVELNDDGVPTISGTTMKVIELVQEHLAHGWNPEELQREHPYLTLGQVYSALAYYWDHTQELDRDIEQRREYAEKMRATARPIPLIERIKQHGQT